MIYNKISELQSKIEHCRSSLLQSIKGQSHLFDDICKYLLIGESGLSDPGRPKASFIALGPTGVGKTETVKCIAASLFDNVVTPVIRLNMSEYKNPEDIQQFLGTSSSPGDFQTLLRQHPDAKIILLDEIEKSHKNIHDLLLQILDEGFLRFYNGESHSFKNQYIWMTSNIGADMATKGLNPNNKTVEQALGKALSNAMRPETVERITCKLFYHRLQTDTQLAIAENIVISEIKRLSLKTGLDVTCENIDPIIQHIRKKGYTPNLGARRMRNAANEAIQMAFIQALSEDVKRGSISYSLQKGVTIKSI